MVLQNNEVSGFCNWNGGYNFVVLLLLLAVEVVIVTNSSCGCYFSCCSIVILVINPCSSCHIYFRLLLNPIYVFGSLSMFARNMNMPLAFLYPPPLSSFNVMLQSGWCVLMLMTWPWCLAWWDIIWMLLLNFSLSMKWLFFAFGSSFNFFTVIEIQMLFSPPSLNPILTYCMFNQMKDLIYLSVHG